MKISFPLQRWSVHRHVFAVSCLVAWHTVSAVPGRQLQLHVLVAGLCTRCLKAFESLGATANNWFPLMKKFMASLP